MPSFSISESGLDLTPAVSINSITNPPTLTTTLTRSLVVPGTSEVIATSFLAITFSKVDLPAFGGPTIAIE